MYSSNSELCRLRSKSCYSNSNHRPQSRHSSEGTCLGRCDVKSSNSCNKPGNTVNHTVDIHEEDVVNIDLPPLMWFGYNKTPKILSATNTGRTILINGQWACGRPYIAGGPLNGSYIFSQIHFHSPSEHEINGRSPASFAMGYFWLRVRQSELPPHQVFILCCRYPLEMHVVHYKNCYLTQERAMKEKDGTVVLVYLFQLVEGGTTIVSHISKLAACLEKKNARRELCKIPLDQFAKPFNSNYYTYQSSVPTDKNRYLLHWIICCNNLCVTRHEVDEMLFVMNSSDSVGHLTTMQPENDIVFRVGEEDYCDWLLCSQTTENPCCHEKKVKSTLSVCKKASKGSVSKKASKECVSKKASKSSVCKKSSKGGLTKKTSKSCVSKKSSKSCVSKKSSKSCVSKKSSKSSVSKKSSKSSVCEEPAKKAARKKSDKKGVCEKSSNTSVGKKSSKKSVSKKRSKTSVNKKSSKTSVCEKSSVITVSEKSSEVSCTSLKEKKKKKRDKSKPKNVDNATNTTPSCSKSDVKEKKQKVKKSKNRSVSKKRSKSKSIEKCSSQSGKSQTSVKNVSSCTSKESSSEKKGKKKMAEAKSSSSKTQSKKSSEDVKEKCSDTHASSSKKALNCSEANVKKGEKSNEKITTLYEKKQKVQLDCPPQDKNVGETKLATAGSIIASACNTERSNSIANMECARIGDNIKNDDDMCDDLRINYLFVPNTSSSVGSKVGNVGSDKTNLKFKENLMGLGGGLTGNTIESKEFVKFPSRSVINHALVKGIKSSVGKPEQTKHLYLHTKHIFRKEGNNREFTPDTFQECHMLIERDHNVLQEYNGILYPSQLSPGNYEQVNLSSRYPDPKNLKIHATECIAKLESPQELSIRAKFLISETDINVQKLETFSTHKPEDSNQMMKSFFDAQCQYEQPVSTSVAIDTKFIEEEVNSCKSLVKWDKRNMGLESLEFKSTEVVNMHNLNFRVEGDVDFRTANEEKNLRKALVEHNATIKLLKNPNTSGSDLETSSKNSLTQKNERDIDKAIDDKSSFKNLKSPSGRCKKTSYFVYDRIEKDENSGKKIFVGNFRTRDEIEVLYKHRNTFHSDRIGSDLSDSQFNNPPCTSGNAIQEDVSEKFIRVEDTQAVNEESAPKKEKQLDLKKEVTILHKFEPKHYHLRTTKKKSKSLIIGKISGKIDTESEKYSQLLDMLGLDKTQHPKISFYEFQESDTRNVNSISLGISKKFDVIDEITVKPVDNSEEKDEGKVFPSTSDKNDYLDGEYKEGLEGTNFVEKRPKSSEKTSQAAVVIIPIEVDSLSKVEIVLIEHSDDVKKQKGENKYTSYLKHYNRLILKLSVRFCSR